MRTLFDISPRSLDRFFLPSPQQPISPMSLGDVPVPAPPVELSQTASGMFAKTVRSLASGEARGEKLQPSPRRSTPRGGQSGSRGGKRGESPRTPRRRPEKSSKAAQAPQRGQPYVAAMPGVAAPAAGGGMVWGYLPPEGYAAGPAHSGPADLGLLCAPGAQSFGAAAPSPAPPQGAPPRAYTAPVYLPPGSFYTPGDGSLESAAPFFQTMPAAPFIGGRPPQQQPFGGPGSPSPRSPTPIKKQRGKATTPRSGSSGKKKASTPSPRGNGKQVKSTSKYRGVTLHCRTGRWEAHIWEGGKQVYLGGYDAEDEAALAYDLAALKCRGPKAELNFDLSNYSGDLHHIQGVSKDELVISLRRQSKGFSRGSSRFRGVTKHQKGKWEARIGQSVGKKYKYLGLYADEEDAARVYDQAAVKQRGLEAVTNFDVTQYKEFLPANERAVLEAYGGRPPQPVLAELREQRERELAAAEQEAHAKFKRQASLQESSGPAGGAPSSAGAAHAASPAANFQGPLAALLESQPQSAEDDGAAVSRQITKALFPDPSKGPEASAEEKEKKLARQLSGQVLHSL